MVFENFAWAGRLDLSGLKVNINTTLKANVTGVLP